MSSEFSLEAIEAAFHAGTLTLERIHAFLGHLESHRSDYRDDDRLLKLTELITSFERPPLKSLHPSPSMDTKSTPPPASPSTPPPPPPAVHDPTSAYYLEGTPTSMMHETLTAATTNPTPPSSSRRVTIRIRNNSLTPSSITVQRGDTVTIVNQSDMGETFTLTPLAPSTQGGPDVLNEDEAEHIDLIPSGGEGTLSLAQVGQFQLQGEVFTFYTCRIRVTPPLPRLASPLAATRSSIPSTPPPPPRPCLPLVPSPFSSRPVSVNFSLAMEQLESNLVDLAQPLADAVLSTHKLCDDLRSHLDRLQQLNQRKSPGRRGTAAAGAMQKSLTDARTDLAWAMRKIFSPLSSRDGAVTALSATSEPSSSSSSSLHYDVARFKQAALRETLRSTLGHLFHATEKSGDDCLLRIQAVEKECQVAFQQLRGVCACIATEYRSQAAAMSTSDEVASGWRSTAKQVEATSDKLGSLFDVIAQCFYEPLAIKARKEECLREHRERVEIIAALSNRGGTAVAREASADLVTQRQQLEERALQWDALAIKEAAEMLHTKMSVAESIERARHKTQSTTDDEAAEAPAHAEARFFMSDDEVTVSDSSSRGRVEEEEEELMEMTTSGARAPRSLHEDIPSVLLLNLSGKVPISHVDRPTTSLLNTPLSLRKSYERDLNENIGQLAKSCRMAHGTMGAMSSTSRHVACDTMYLADLNRRRCIAGHSEQRLAHVGRSIKAKRLVTPPALTSLRGEAAVEAVFTARSDAWWSTLSVHDQYQVLFSSDIGQYHRQQEEAGVGVGGGVPRAEARQPWYVRTPFDACTVLMEAVRRIKMSVSVRVVADLLDKLALVVATEDMEHKDKEKDKARGVSIQAMHDFISHGLLLAQTMDHLDCADDASSRMQTGQVSFLSPHASFKLPKTLSDDMTRIAAGRTASSLSLLAECIAFVSEGCYGKGLSLEYPAQQVDLNQADQRMIEHQSQLSTHAKPFMEDMVNSMALMGATIEISIRLAHARVVGAQEDEERRRALERPVEEVLRDLGGEAVTPPVPGGRKSKSKKRASGGQGAASSLTTVAGSTTATTATEEEEEASVSSISRPNVFSALMTMATSPDVPAPAAPMPPVASSTVLTEENRSVVAPVPVPQEKGPIVAGKGGRAPLTTTPSRPLPPKGSAAKGSVAPVPVVGAPTPASTLAPVAKPLAPTTTSTPPQPPTPSPSTTAKHPVRGEQPQRVAPPPASHPPPPPAPRVRPAPPPPPPRAATPP